MDTVGFISDLPQILYTAFRATLEEVRLADIIVHIRDINHPETEYQKESVLSILSGIGTQEGVLENHIEIWNKIDLLTKKKLKTMMTNNSNPNVVPISAKYGVRCDQLVSILGKRVAEWNAKYNPQNETREPELPETPEIPEDAEKLD